MWNKATDFIAEWEGFSGNPYFCPANIPTIGYGEVIKSHKQYAGVNGKTLTDDCYQIFVNNGKDRKKVNKILVSKYTNLVTQSMARSDLMSIAQDKWRTISHSLPDGLNDNQCSAIISLVYNIGVGAFSRSTLLKEIKINPNNRVKIEREFNRWVLAGGKKIDGLKKRRQAEINLYFS